MPFEWPEDFWPMQRRGCQGVTDAICRGVRRIVLTAPTGSGKSRCMVSLIEWAASETLSSILYTPRRLLFTQTSNVLKKHGVKHGYRASGYKTDLAQPVQLAMTQTERVAVLSKKIRDIHDAGLVLEDELHAQGGNTIQELNRQHYEAGAYLVGVTATPIDLEGEWDELIVAGTTSEGRECGALVPAHTYCPDFPDLKHIKKYRVGEDLSDADNAKIMMRPGVFGRVLTHWRKLNPKQKATILFAPDVAGSIYFAKEFAKEGIASAHIDAKEIWWRGEMIPSNDENREKLLQAFRNDEISVLSNRFVCLDTETEILTREGWVNANTITPEHHVANWEDGRVYFETPLEIMRRQRAFNEKMVVLETPRRSIRVTASHKLLYRTARSGRFLKARADCLVDKCLQLPVSGVAEPEDIAPEQPDMLANLQRRITANAFVLRSKGWPADDSRAEAERRLRARGTLRYKTPKELSLDECEFIGLWIGDGNKSVLQKGGIEYRLYQPAKYQRIVARIDSLIELLGYDSVRSDGERESAFGRVHSVHWSFPRGTGFGPQARRGVFPIEPYLDKSGSNLLWGLSDAQFQALLHGLWLANGMQHRDSIAPPDSRLMIYSANKTLLDRLQAIAVCRGYRASIRSYPQTKDPGQTMYLLTLTKAESHACSKYRLATSGVWSPEEVWCVRTSSGNIITRRKGSVTVMGNCREGIDLPHVYCGIFACVVGSLKSWLQMGGRILRNGHTDDHCLIIDHGGNYIRHGSLNDDREWVLGQNGYKTTALRQEEMRENPEREPIICPVCHAARLAGNKCPFCGHESHKHSRIVVQIDGSLKCVEGPSYRKRYRKLETDTAAKWERQWYRAKSPKWNATFAQAEAEFFIKNGYYPPRDLPLMPRELGDFFERVADVPRERLL